MNECLDLNIQVVPRFYGDGRLEVRAMLNGRGLYEHKHRYKLVELFYSTIKPMTLTSEKIRVIRSVRKQTEELLAILAVQEVALQGTVTEPDIFPF